MRCVSTETVDDGPIRHGEFLFASAVSGANVVRDVREAITNVVGGKMTRYEAVLDSTISRALEKLCARAKEAGYDGIVRVQISHPHITDGAIEVVATGTGFWYDQQR